MGETYEYLESQLDLVKTTVESNPLLNLDTEYAPLFVLAANGGHFELVKYLVENGVTPTIFNNEAIILANNEGHEKIVEYLKSKGGTINDVGMWGHLKKM